MVAIDATKLTAVNDVMRGARLAPVTALGATRDATNAEAVLDRVIEHVQSEGWAFNMQHEVTLTPAGGVITLASDVIQASPHYSESKPFDVRDGKLYDLDENSDSSWAQNVKADLLIALDIDKMPVAARQYVVARAAHEFSRDYLGNNSQTDRLERQEMQAKANLMNHESRAYNFSALQSATAARIAYRPEGNAADHAF